MGAVWLFALLLSAAPAPDAPRSRPAAEAADAALSHYEAGRYDEARDAIARAYMIEPWPEFLYARAQIERADGDCVAAREFYGLYLEADPPEQGASLAREGIDACPVSPPQPKPVDAGDTTVPRRKPKAAWGIALTSTGGAALVTGMGLYLGADAARRAAERSTTHDRFGDHIDRARRLGVAGSAMVSIGAVLVVAGVVHLVVVRHRMKSAGRVAWHPTGLALRW